MGNYRDDQDALMQRLAALEQQVRRTEKLEQRVMELEAENRRLRKAAATAPAVNPDVRDHAVPSVGEAEVHVDPKLLEYVDRIIAMIPAAKDKDGRDVVLSGARPADAGLVIQAAMVRAAQVGRKYVVPADIKTVAPDVLSNRIILTEEAANADFTGESLVSLVLDAVEVP